MSNPNDTTHTPEPPATNNAVDQDGQIARYARVLTQLQELMPSVAHIDDVLRAVTPSRPGRRRRWLHGDEALFDALRPLPSDLAADFDTAIGRLQEALEAMRESAAEEARAELEEAEERVRELRRRLGEGGEGEEAP